VEQTPNRLLWIYIKSVYTHNTIHIHTPTYIYTYLHLYTHNINTHTHDVRTAVMLKIRVFRDVTPCRLVSGSEISKDPETSPSGSSSHEMKAIQSFEMSGRTHPTTQRDIPEDTNLLNQLLGAEPFLRSQQVLS
jgi:hypothetical protein